MQSIQVHLYRLIPFVAILVCNGSLPTGSAQHTDTQFSYVGGKIDVLPPSESGGLVFRSSFPTSGIEQQFTTLPGFASEHDVGLGIGAGDQIYYNVLEDLLYWDGMDFQPPPSGMSIRVRNNPTSSPNTVIDADSGVQLGSITPPVNRLGAAGSQGDFHTDLQWFLEPNPFPFAPDPNTFGAYGVMLTLSTSAPNIADSDPIIYVFNFGLNATDFNTAVDAFSGLLLPDIPGDFHKDGKVDALDLAVWQQQYGTTSGLPMNGDNADADGDGDVDGSDFLHWQVAYGGTGQSTFTSSVVPEGNSLTMLCFLFAALISWKRLRRFVMSKCLTHSIRHRTKMEGLPID